MRRRSAQHVEVSGNVTYKGKPVTGGQVTFVADDGYSSNGTIDEKGHYTIQAPAGNVKIAVDNKMLILAREAGKMGAGMRPGAPKPEKLKGKYMELPSKYRLADTSGLSYMVKPGAPQTFDIDLKE